MEKKFTPGPWKLDKWGSIVDSNGDTLKIVGVALPGFNNKEAVANRDLLFAAPELLEALEEIASGVFCDLKSVEDYAHKIIAKAYGKE